MSAARRVVAARLRSAGSTLILLAVLVSLAAALAAAAPLALTHAASLELRSSISALTEELRDPSGQIGDLTVIDLPLFSADPATEETAYGGLFGALEEARAAQPEPLRSALSDAEVVIIGDAVLLEVESPEAADPAFQIRTIVDPLLDERVRVVEGRLPDRWVPSSAPPPTGSLFEPDPTTEQPSPIEVVLTVEGAEALRWVIGERRIDPVSETALVLVGVVEPVDVDAAYWRRVPAAPAAERFDDGNQRPRETAAAFVNSLSVGAPTAFGPISVWFPLDVSQLDAGTIEQFLPQLRAFLSTGLTVPLALAGETQTTNAPLSSGVPGAADDVLDRTSVATAVLALMVSGPIGLVSVVLLLASRSTIDRRRPVLALQLARGASPARLRFTVVLDSLASTAPATVIGAVVGAVTVVTLTGQNLAAAAAALTAPPTVLVLLLIALVPPVVLAGLLPRASDLRERRADLVAPGRARTLVELVVVTLAALSVWFVLQRGFVTSASAVGIDPLLAAMPLLVALVASVLTMRLYPLVIAGAQRITGRRGSAVSMIGSRRASRERSVGLPIVVATVIASAVAVSSLSLLAVIDGGLDDAARDRLGAAVRITGSGVSAELIDATRELSEASAVGGIDVVGPAVLGVDGVRENATVITIDETTARLRDDAPPAWPPGSATADGDRVPVMFSDDLLPLVDGLPEPDAAIAVDGVPVTVVAIGRTSTGYGAPSSWVLIGEADAARFTSTPAVDTVLVEPSQGVSAADLGGAISALASASGVEAVRVSIAAEEAAEQRAVPLTAALRTTLLAAAALAVGLVIVGLAVAAVLGRPRRQRTQALAHVLGMQRSSALVAWELGPPAITGTVVGGLVGVALVPLAVAAIDLRFVTGAADPVAASIDGANVGVVIAALVLAVSATVAVVTALDRRPPLLTTLRTESS